MAELPFLPLKADALLADTNHMTPEQMGAYTRIILTMWLHGARLPDDDRELAQIVGISGRRWATIRDVVLRPIVAAGGELSQKRLTDTWLKVQELRGKRSHAANVRHNRASGHANAYPNASAHALLTKTKIDTNLSSLNSEPRTAMLKPEELIASPDLVKLIEEQNRKRGMPPASSATALDGAPPRPATKTPYTNGKVPHRTTKEELDAIYASKAAQIAKKPV